MDNDWFCDIAGEEMGPVSLKQLQAMVAEGKLQPNDRVRHGVFAVWKLARQVKRLFLANGKLQETKGSTVTPASHAIPQPPLPLDLMSISETSSGSGQFNLDQKPSGEQWPEAMPDNSSVDSADSANSTDAGQDLMSLGIPVKVSSEGSALLAYTRRRREQQQRLIRLLVIVGVGAVTAILVLIFSYSIGDTEKGRGSVGQVGSAKESKKSIDVESVKQNQKPSPPAPIQKALEK